MWRRRPPCWTARPIPVASSWPSRARRRSTNDVAYIATELRGDGDGLLEPGETAEVRIDVSTIADGTLVIGPSEDWTLQIVAPSGGIVRVSRTIPFALHAVNSLH